MTRFNFLKLNKTKKIRYLKHDQKNSAYIVFLHGFMSDLEGKKPKTFLNFAKKNKLGFLAFEYSGHGKSSGKFINGNISTWTKQASLLINKIVKKNEPIITKIPVIFVTFRSNPYPISQAKCLISFKMWKLKVQHSDKIINLPKRPGEPDCTWANVNKLKQDTKWKPRIMFEDGIKDMLYNISDWKDAPLWNKKKIFKATKLWFKYLS